MQALQFEMNIPKIILTRTLGLFSYRAFIAGYAPVQLADIPEARLRGDDWVVVRPTLTGICGSDQKQLLLKGHFDNPISGIISFPHVLGHETCGVVAEVGAGVSRVKPGDRVAINPWLSCAPRGITPLCPSCAEGNLSICHNFDSGGLRAGLHLGNCNDAPGAYAARVALHESQVFPLPVSVSDEQAVLADPFAVSFHAVVKDPPEGDEPTVLVYGAGTIGLAAVAAVKVVRPKARIVVIARYPQQEEAARRLGASEVITSRKGKEIIATIARLTGARPWGSRWHGLPMLAGGVDAVYDSICSPDTIEIGLRLVRPRGILSIIGVEAPKRFEWTPLYFKELRVVGSNAFGVEEFRGVRKHAIEHYIDLCAAGEVDLAFLVTHRYGLADWRDAFLTAIRKRTGCIKVAFQFA
ncbi:zinc-binding dehydrogenase [bacterium]|nr:zinc-binding dehydrogenase [bacterium]